MNVEREFKPDYYSLRLLNFHKFPSRTCSSTMIKTYMDYFCVAWLRRNGKESIISLPALPVVLYLPQYQNIPECLVHLFEHDRPPCWNFSAKRQVDHGWSKVTLSRFWRKKKLSSVKPIISISKFPMTMSHSDETSRPCIIVHGGAGEIQIQHRTPCLSAVKVAARIGYLTLLEVSRPENLISYACNWFCGIVCFF